MSDFSKTPGFSRANEKKEAKEMEVKVGIDGSALAGQFERDEPVAIEMSFE